MAIKPTYQPLTKASAQLGLPLRFVRDEARAGRIPSIIANRRLFIDVDGARAALAERAAANAEAGKDGER